MTNVKIAKAVGKTSKDVFSSAAGQARTTQCARLSFARGEISRLVEFELEGLCWNISSRQARLFEVWRQKTKSTR